MTPQRIQRKRTKGWKQPPNTRYCGRGTMFGNVFVVKALPKKRGERQTYQVESCVDWHWYQSEIFFSKRSANARAVEMWEDWIKGYDKSWWDEVKKLNQYDNLSCFCPLDMPCHLDPIIEFLENL